MDEKLVLEIEEISLKIDLFERQLSDICFQTSQISKEFDKLGNSIKTYSSDVSGFTTSLTKELGAIAKEIGKSGNNKKYELYGSLAKDGAEVVGKIAGGIVEIAGECIKGIGSIWTSMKKRYYEKKVLKKKKEYANQMYDDVLNEHKKAMAILNKTIQLYDKDVQEIALADSNLIVKVKIFRLILLLYIRIVYLVAQQEYVLNEFQAWFAGMQTAGQKNESIKEHVSNHIQKVVKQIGIETDWNWKSKWYNDIIPKLCMLKKGDKIRIEFLVFLIDPYILHNFVGVGVGSEISTNRIGARWFGIRIFEDKCYFRKTCYGISYSEVTSEIKEILLLNPYFKECTEFFEKNGIIRYPRFWIDDGVIILSTLALFSWWGYYVWTNIVGWKFVCLIILTIVLAIGAIGMFSVTLLPYHHRVTKYRRTYGKYISKLEEIFKKYKLGCNL